MTRTKVADVLSIGIVVIVGIFVPINFIQHGISAPTMWNLCAFSFGMTVLTERTYNKLLTYQLDQYRKWEQQVMKDNETE